MMEVRAKVISVTTLGEHLEGNTPVLGTAVECDCVICETHESKLDPYGMREEVSRLLSHSMCFLRFGLGIL